MADNTLKLVSERTDLIEALNSRLEKQVGKSQSELLDMIIADFVDKLDTQGGKITNTLRNQRLVALLDKVFVAYVENHGVLIAQSIVDGVQSVVSFNKRYFSVFDKPAKLNPIHEQVKTTISSWLGIEEGGVAKNGYLDTLVKADAVKLQIKNLAFGKVVNQAGLSETRKAVKDLLTEDAAGAKELGGLQKYYRNFAKDLYSTVDRTAAKITGDKLKLKYAIFEGPKMKTSRAWCLERKGKVFTTEEIAAFDPPVAKQPGYNPFTDLGGYGCVDHLNYIPYAVAVSLRPDLKEQVKGN